MTARSMIGGLAMLGALSGCSMGGGMDGGGPVDDSAVAMLRTSAGTDVGRAVATGEANGVRIVIDARAMPSGIHGVHVHAVGKCDGPDFTTAGPHWNPGAMKHGIRNPAGPHAGDLPNLTIADDGAGTLSMMLPSGTLEAMLDADGAAFVVHAAADDMMTDPSGNSGGRIACGVFSRS